MLRIGSVVFFVARTPAMSLAGIWAWPWRPEPPRAGILDNCELSSRGVAVCWPGLLTNGGFSDSGAALVQHVDMGQRSFRMIETNGLTLRVVVEGQGRSCCCCMAFHNAGICGATRSTN